MDTFSNDEHNIIMNRKYVIIIIFLHFPMPQIIQYFNQGREYVADDYTVDYVKPTLHVGSVSGISDTTYFSLTH